MILMKCSLKDNDSYTYLFERNNVYHELMLLKRTYPHIFLFDEEENI